MKWYKRVIFRRWIIGVWFLGALLWDIGFGHVNYEIDICTLLLVSFWGIAVAVMNRPRTVDLEETDECFLILPVRERPWSSRLLGIGAVLLIVLMWPLAGLTAMISVVLLSNLFEALEIARMERRLGKPLFLPSKQTGLATG